MEIFCFYMAVELKNSMFIHVPKTGGRWVKQMLFNYVEGAKAVGDAVYDYAAMGTAETASDAAAFLVWHAGVAVNMDYDCPGSGAQVTGGYPSALYALENSSCEAPP